MTVAFDFWSHVSSAEDRQLRGVLDLLGASTDAWERVPAVRQLYRMIACRNAVAHYIARGCDVGEARSRAAADLGIPAATIRTTLRAMTWLDSSQNHENATTDEASTCTE